MNIVKDNVPAPELLAGLAEECAELAKAALKLRRVLDGTNPTPVSREEADVLFCEEIADVMLYLEMIDYDKTLSLFYKKIKLSRWEDRIVKRIEERLKKNG